MKKSAKRSNNLASIVKLVVAIMAILAFCMAFLPFVTQNTWLAGKIQATKSLSGFVEAFGASAAVKIGDAAPEWMAFGGKASSASTDGTITYTIAGNAGMMITLILVIAGFALSAVSLLFKGKSAKLGGYILSLAALCLIAVGIMSFFAVNFGGFESSLAGTDTKVAGNALTSGTEYTLGTGAIISAIASLIGGVLGLGGAFLSLKK